MKRVYPFILAFITVFSSCVNEPSKKITKEKVEETIIPNSPELEKKKMNQVQRIFYSLPSPLELSLLFKKEGVVYYPSQLHQVDKKDMYLVSKKKALNLGVYGADLSYAGLFSKHEDAIQYFTICQGIAEDVGIGNSFEQEFIARLERNANNRDTLLQVISDFFLSNNNYLKDQDLQNTSSYVLAGGWIEGLYLGSNMIDENTNAEGIKNVVASQKYSLENLLLLLENIEDKGSFENLNEQLKSLYTIYEEIQYPKFKTPKDSVDADGVRYIDNMEGEIVVSIETFETIKLKVTEIRNSIIE